ncbi:MAG TPA: hypothetical protein VFW07_00415 [Parafilimonas sp.]|nr:hypothetical protein [Parafilimonas sp.]
MNHKTMITEHKHITGAYTALRHFFEVFDLPSARNYIQTSLLAANSSKLWKGACPADLVYFYEAYKKLLHAAVIITGSDCIRQTGIITPAEDRPVPDFTNLNLYCKLYDETEYWLYIPRHLTVKEFFNPYKALKKAVRSLTKEDAYDNLFDTIVQYALSYNSFTDASLEWDTLQLNIMLQKLMEAAYLLHVRTCITKESLHAFDTTHKETADAHNTEPGESKI